MASASGVTRAAAPAFRHPQARVAGQAMELRALSARRSGWKAGCEAGCGPGGPAEGWRERTAACQFDRRIRHDPAFRFARKRFYRSMLAEHRLDRRELVNAFRL